MFSADLPPSPLQSSFSLTYFSMGSWPSSWHRKLWLEGPQRAAPPSPTPHHRAQLSSLCTLPDVPASGCALPFIYSALSPPPYLGTVMSLSLSLFFFPLSPEVKWPLPGLYQPSCPGSGAEVRSVRKQGPGVKGERWLVPCFLLERCLEEGWPAPSSRSTRRPTCL